VPIIPVSMVLTDIHVVSLYSPQRHRVHRGFKSTDERK